MPRGKSNAKNTKGASGAGTIRKKTVKRNGKEYTYWEARYTTGFDPGTGKQIQKSVTGKTQKEVAEKLREITCEVDQGTYIEPSKMTLGEWLDIWEETYLIGVKPRTIEVYHMVIKNHIKPAMGAVRLEALTPHMIQNLYNDCTREKGLSAKSVKNVHCVLHRSLRQATLLGYIRYNPTDACILPRVEKKDIKPLDDYEMGRFLKEISGNPLKTLMVVTLFTGMRQGEIMGLTWDCVDFVRGTLTVNKQLQYFGSKGGGYKLVSTKNGKSRVIVPASFVMGLLRKHKSAQAELQLKAGPAWEQSSFVFTDELGGHMKTWNVYREFKRAVTAIGRPDARFHDMRHSYAVAAIRSGDDIKTVQGNLGHATASFTLDVYGHVTDQMKQDSARRMDRYIEQVMGQ